MTHNKIDYLKILHENGYRITRQKLAVLDAICQADGHASVGEVYYRAKVLDEGIDRSTIYRTLDLFVKLGLVISADNVEGEKVYELVKESQHHHLICKVCGDEIEIENEVVDDFYQRLTSAYNYAVDMDHLIIFGVCVTCSN